MTVWVKESGQEIELNDEKETVEKAEELGWKRKALRGRPPMNKERDNVNGE